MEVLYAAALATVSGCVLFAYDAMVPRFGADPAPAAISRFRILTRLSAPAAAVFYIGIIALLLMAVVALTNDLFGAAAERWSGLIATATVAAGFFLALIARKNISRFARLHAAAIEPPDAGPNAGAALPHFTAMQYYAFMMNRTYCVFIAPAMLCGARVRGVVTGSDEPSQIGNDPRMWIDTPLRAMYARMDVTSAAVGAMDPANFQLAWSQIARVEFSAKTKWGMADVPYSGRIFVHLKAGGRRELILLGTQDGPALQRQLEAARHAASQSVAPL